MNTVKMAELPENHFVTILIFLKSIILQTKTVQVQTVLN